MLPVAHAAHWVLYLGPVLIVLIAVAIGAIRERRRQAAAEGSTDPVEDPRNPV